MSATATKIFASAVALSISIGAANAQQMSSDFFSGMTSSQEDMDTQKARILQTIEGMMEEVSSLEAPDFTQDAVTIEEIDQQNRQTQRLTKELELRQIKFQEMTAQIEMLLALEKARQSLVEEEKPAEVDEGPTVQIQQEQANSEAAAKESQAQQAQAMMAREQMDIPRVEAIFGSGGQQEATLVSVTGTVQEVVPGDTLADGFQVAEITSKGVLITGMATGNKYFILPSEPTAPQGDEQNQPIEAVDLGTTGFPGSF